MPDRDLYESLFERNRAVKLLLDPTDGRIVDANPAACDFYGYERARMRSMNITDLNHMPAEMVRERMQEALEGSTTEFIFQHFLATGEPRTVLVHSGSVSAGERQLLLSIVHDITEEAILRSVLERFFDATSDALCVVGENGRIVRANTAFAHAAGRDPERVLTERLTDLIHEEDREQVAAALDRTSAERVSLECRLVTSDGDVRTLTWGILWDGELRHFYVAARDVTEERRLQEAQRTATVAMTMAQSMAHMGSWEWTIGEPVIRWSEEVFRIFGLPAPPGGGPMAFADFVAQLHPEDQLTVSEAIDAFRPGDVPAEMRYRVVRPDGTERTVLGRAQSLLGSDASRRVVGIVLDITDQVRTEERLRLIADFTPDWETLVDAEGRAVWTNPVAERFTGYTAEDCLALPEYPLPLVHPDDRQRVQSLLAAAAEGASGNDVPFRIVRRDGRVVWVAISWQPVRGRDGQFEGYRSSVRDITERRRNDEGRDRLVAELRVALGTVRTLRGLLPVCASCHAFRDDDSYRARLDAYVAEHSESAPALGLCPTCQARLFPARAVPPPEKSL